MLKTNYQQYIHISKYARWDEGKARREIEWSETVVRYVDFMENHSAKNLGYRWPSELKEQVFNYMMELRVMPSMRALMTAGEALKRDNAAGYNCSFVPVDNVHAFAETLYLLMCGSGVGFSVESRYVYSLPVVPDAFGVFGTFCIEDSKIGWAEAILFLFGKLYEGKIPSFDYSKIRPAGSRLKVFGGRASGSEPLKGLIEYITAIFKSAKGRKLRPIECHDIICKIASIVVMGGVRRSALISLSDLHDDEMRTAKHGSFWEKNSQRAYANNSAVYTEKPCVESFMREWLSLVESKCGERGIVNQQAFKKQVERNGRRKSEYHFGCNPCMSVNTPVICRSKGLTTIGEIGEGSEIWSKEGWTKVTAKEMTGRKEVYKYKTKAGFFLGTGNHRVVSNGVKEEIDNVGSIDVCYSESYDINEGLEKVSHDLKYVADGLVLGDGSVHKASNNLIYLNVSEKDTDYFTDAIKDLFICERWGLSSSKEYCSAYEIETGLSSFEVCKVYDRKIPTRYKESNNIVRASLLRGLYSANGSFVGDSRVSYKTTSPNMRDDIMMMLNSLGIRCYYTVNKSKMCTFENGVYECRESYDINITTDIDKFCYLIGFIQKYKQEKLEKRIQNKGTSKYSNIKYKKTYDVYEKEFVAIEDVWDISVDNETKTFWSGGLDVSNCAEIILRPQEFCNLTEVVIRPADNHGSLLEKIKIATFLGTVQSTFTDFQFLRPEWRRNCEEERLLGVSLTGIFDCPWMSTVDSYLGSVLKSMKEFAVKVNKQYANIFGINQSVAVTTIKPSGTVSQLVNCSSGIHPRLFKYYYRTVRENKISRISSMMKDQGLRHENCCISPETVDVFYFPMKSPKNAFLSKDLDALEHLRVWKFYQEHYCEHKPSATIYVKNKDWLRVGDWVYSNFDDVSGVSFLPLDDNVYNQAPYIEITKEEYEKAIVKQPEINWSELPKYESDDETKINNEFCCTGGACEL